MSPRAKLAALIFGGSSAIAAAYTAMDHGAPIDCSPKAKADREAEAAVAEISCFDSVSECETKAKKLFDDLVKQCP